MGDGVDKGERLKGPNESAETEEYFRGMPSEVVRAYALMTSLDRRFKLFYFVPHLTQKLEDASPLGFYTPGLLAAAEPLMMAATLPADIREPHTDRSSVLIQRILRGVWPFVTPITIESVADIHKMVGTPFQVYLTNNITVADRVDCIFNNAEIPVLHASTIRGRNRIGMSDLLTNGIAKYTRHVLDKLAGKDEWRDFVLQARQLLSSSPQVRLRKHPLRAGHHNLVTPNEVALLAFGWKLHRSKPISQPLMRKNSPETYISRICESADAVSKERDDLIKGCTTLIPDHRFILAVSSVYWGHYKHWRAFVQNATPEQRKDLKRAFSSIVQARSYFDHIEADQFGKPLLGSFQRALMRLQREDMRAFTAGLSLLAAASFVPVIRLEPKLNSIRGELKLIAHCTRAEIPRRQEWKTSRLITKLGERMRSLIAPAFLQRIDELEKADKIEGMKIVSDLPIELLPTNGVPLGLRFNTSRLSPLPGNIFLQQCSLPPLLLEQKDFEQILVIRSFAEEDRLKLLFERATNHFCASHQTTKVSHKFVDVTSEDEIVRAISSFKGAIVVFDCHGRFDSDLGMGTLVIGGKSLNPWNLKNKIQMPPIVMFSACDTLPMDGSHGSVATAAFALGARAVLATVLPIRAQEAAVFSGRMSLRLAEFIPAALKVDSHLTWRDVVSGMLRMSHCTEVLRRLIRHAGLSVSDDDYSHVLLSANVAINGRNIHWYEIFLKELASCTGRSMASLRDDIQKWAGLTEAMKHTQLGSPENIIIVEKHPERILAESYLTSS